MRIWRWWAAEVDRERDVRPLALLRILAPGCVLIDLLHATAIGMNPWYFRTAAHGGLGATPSEAYLLGEPLGALFAWGGTVGCMALASLGIATRPALLAGALLYAQLGHLYPPGDRGIDRILRTVLLILAFSGVHQRWSVQNWFFQEPIVEKVAGWPFLLIRWLLVLVYVSAGVAKLIDEPTWLSWSAPFPPLYRLLGDPLSSDVDPRWLAGWIPLMRVGSAYTIVVELAAVLILTRWRKFWAIPGAFIHVGIASTMVLGMFSYGMLALYCVLVDDWLCRLFDRIPALRNPSGAT